MKIERHGEGVFTLGDRTMLLTYFARIFPKHFALHSHREARQGKFAPRVCKQY